LKSEKRSGFLQRSRIDIMACILENSNDKSRKTRLRRGDGVEIFGTTEKGKEFLSDYRKIKSVMDEMRL
jgi:predicted transcriptional regulator